MEPRGPSRKALVVPVAVAALALVARVAAAHERFVKHRLKNPLDDAFFRRVHGAFLGMNPNITVIGAHVVAVVGAFLLAWFMRHPLESFASTRLLRPLRGRAQRAVHALACYLTDRPVRSRVFHALGEWALILFMRSPGLVLMYSAANDSLVMPSYPLDPPSATFFKFAQVGLAILILTQTLLPLCGALLFGVWLYLNRWGWMVAIDALPILTVAAVYVTSPWQSHKIALTRLNAVQVRWLRIVLGGSFFVLGWLKIYNHDLVAGVADNYPSVMDDPVVKLLAVGTDPRWLREWVVSFGMAEVMSGFLLMIGVFTRVWSTIMAVMLTKLMLVDFGWEEIPHIYPIGAMLALVFSNQHSSEFDRIEQIGDRLGRQGRLARQAVIFGAPSIATGVLVVFPVLYALTFLARPSS